MNPPELTQLFAQHLLDKDENFDLRLEFGIACIVTVEHLLINPTILEALAIGKKYLAGESTRAQIDTSAANAQSAAKSHEGTNSLDGSGSAAVSTSYGVAAALAGRALEAAEYAAYATVYSYSSHAVSDMNAYSDVHKWQIKTLQALTDSRAT